MPGIRVELMADAQFRKDIIALARGCLREVAREVIGVALSEDGWLQKQLDAYLVKNPLNTAIVSVLRGSSWHNQPAVADALKQIAKSQVEEAMKFERREAENKLRELVRAEMTKGLKVTVG